MLTPRLTVLLVAVWLVSQGAVAAQQEATPGGDRLLGLAGRTTMVRYTPGYKHNQKVLAGALSVVQKADGRARGRRDSAPCPEP